MNFKNFLPNKYIIAFIVIPIFALIIFFLLKDKLVNTKNLEDFNFTKKQLVETLKEEIKSKDSDGDGLRDWEERIYNTSINNPDTDGDGITDALEVKSGTDPLDSLNKKSKDKIKKIRSEDIREEENIELSFEDTLAQNLLIKTVSLKKANLINNQDAREKVIEEILSQNNFHFQDKFKKEDLNIKNVFKNTIHKKIMDLIEKYKIGDLKNNYILFAKYRESGDKKYLEELKNNVSVLDKFMEDSKKIEINKEISDAYLKYLNDFNNYNEASRMLSLVEESPMVSFIALEKISRIEEEMFRSAKDLALVFK